MNRKNEIKSAVNRAIRHRINGSHGARRLALDIARHHSEKLGAMPRALSAELKLEQL